MIYDVMCMYTCMCMHLGHSSDVKTVAISPDGKYIVSGSEDESIKVWDFSSGREIHTLTGKTCYYFYTTGSISIFNKSIIVIWIIKVVRRKRRIIKQK